VSVPPARGRRESTRITRWTVGGLALGLIITVVATTRAVGAQERSGASPDDCVAEGERIVKVPDVRGEFLRIAIRKVEKRGLNVVGFGTSDSAAPTARVWAQKPAGGERAPLGACIGFRTGCAAQGDAAVSVPDVRGKLLRVAIRSLAKRGLTVVGYGTPPTDSTAPTARVRVQEPPSGERAWLGACIGLRTR
jgi:beta-lactam-binding protein with PASTA domain